MIARETTPRRAPLAPRIHRLVREQRIGRPLPEVFGFFAEARNIQRVTLPWLGFTLRGGQPDDVRQGTPLEYRAAIASDSAALALRDRALGAEQAFVDRQLEGPYRLWRHWHDFTAIPEGTIMRDGVRYALPLGPVGELAHELFVRRALDRILDFRRRAVAERLG
jgi:ligand-binding SRPBCC domain-containing protein